MKMADYLKYCQTKLSALENMSGNSDLRSIAAFFQSSDASTSAGSEAGNQGFETQARDSVEENNAAPASEQDKTAKSGTASSPVLSTDKCQNQNTKNSQSIKTAGEINLSLDLSGNNLVQGLIMSEILGSPRSKRRGTSTWNSRF